MSTFKEFINYKKVFKNQERRLKFISFFRFIPSYLYLKIVFWIKTGKKLNLKKPVTFCDKQNWLKLHMINWEYSNYVDKIKVRDIVNSKIGEDICFDILGHWEKYEDIDFDSLPNEFVLKCNHDSSSVTIVRDKDKIDHKYLKKFYNSRLKTNIYAIGREYPYKKVKPQIMAERLMKQADGEGLKDYKFFCFNGKAEIMFIASDRNTDCRFDFYDMNFNHLDIQNIHPNSDKTISKPKNFNRMVEVAQELSKGIPFVRIDLYEIDEKVYFGEYTFFHGGGFWPMKPEEWETKLGDKIIIDDSK